MKKTAQRLVQPEMTPGSEQSSASSSPNQPNSETQKSLPSDRSVSPEMTPGSEEASSELRLALQARYDTIQKRIASGDGDLTALLQERTKVAAQLRSPKPESTPGSSEASKDLGGNGMNENPKSPVKEPSSKKLKAEETPGSNEASKGLGGDGINKNPAAPAFKKASVLQIGRRVAQFEDFKSFVATSTELPMEDVTSLFELEEHVRTAGLGDKLSGYYQTYLGSEKGKRDAAKNSSASDIAMLKEMGILPKDFKSAQSNDIADGSLGLKKPSERNLTGEEFPESKEGVTVPPPAAARVGDVEDHPGNQGKGRKAQFNDSRLPEIKQDLASKLDIPAMKAKFAEILAEQDPSENYDDQVAQAMEDYYDTYSKDPKMHWESHCPATEWNEQCDNYDAAFYELLTGKRSAKRKAQSEGIIITDKEDQENKNQGVKTKVP
jgi:hypothetical protein